MIQCPHCVGRGFIRSHESMSIQIIRAIEKEASSGNWGALRLIAPQAVALHLLNHKRDILRAIEQRYNVAIQVLIDSELTMSEFNLEKMRRSNNDRKAKHQERQKLIDHSAIAAEFADQPMIEEPEAEGEEASSEERSDEQRGNRRRRGRRGGRNRNRDRNDRNNEPRILEQPEGEEASDAGESEEIAAEGNTSPNERGDRPRRNRGRRGGRGRRQWREGEEGGQRQQQENNAPQDNVVAFEKPAENSPPLPAFTNRPAVMPAAPAPAPVLESTPRDPNAQPKKGWWQRMIQLDE